MLDKVHSPHNMCTLYNTFHATDIYLPKQAEILVINPSYKFLLGLWEHYIHAVALGLQSVKTELLCSYRVQCYEILQSDWSERGL